ncbi:hypothetical protein K4F52_010255, partial [Lecanicillium sp. MT-2017a]
MEYLDPNEDAAIHAHEDLKSRWKEDIWDGEWAVNGVPSGQWPHSAGRAAGFLFWDEVGHEKNYFRALTCYGSQKDTIWSDEGLSHTAENEVRQRWEETGLFDTLRHDVAPLSDEEQLSFLPRKAREALRSGKVTCFEDLRRKSDDE